MNTITCRDIVKVFGTYTALNHVSIEVPKGTIFGLLGPNGAGKTTLIRIMNQITVPNSGIVLFNGNPVVPDDVYRIGYLPEERGLYKKMKVGEQALYLARLKGLSRQQAMTELKKWFVKFGIEGWWNKKVEELSKGMAQKVQFITTVLHRPELLILDEPFSGFDPVNAQLIRDEILRMRDEGTTVILSTHNMASVEELCDNIALINKSNLVVTGGVEQIRREHGRNQRLTGADPRFRRGAQGHPQGCLRRGQGYALGSDTLGTGRQRHRRSVLPRADTEHERYFHPISKRGGQVIWTSRR